MPRQNRVTPWGEINAVPDRGMFMGNRGTLHDANGRLGLPVFSVRAGTKARLMPGPGVELRLRYATADVEYSVGSSPFSVMRCTISERTRWSLLLGCCGNASTFYDLGGGQIGGQSVQIGFRRWSGNKKGPEGMATGLIIVVLGLLAERDLAR